MTDIAALASQQVAGTLANAKNQMKIDRLNKAVNESVAATGERPEIDAKRMAKIEATAQDFEAVFITEMLKPMMNMVEVDSQFGGGRGEEVFRDFTINEYGKKLASQGGIGIAKHVKDQLIRLQEAGSGS